MVEEHQECEKEEIDIPEEYFDEPPIEDNKQKMKEDPPRTFPKGDPLTEGMTQEGFKSWRGKNEKWNKLRKMWKHYHGMNKIYSPRLYEFSLLSVISSLMNGGTLNRLTYCDLEDNGLMINKKYKGLYSKEDDEEDKDQIKLKDDGTIDVDATVGEVKPEDKKIDISPKWYAPKGTYNRYSNIPEQDEQTYEYVKKLHGHFNTKTGHTVGNFIKPIIPYLGTKNADCRIHIFFIMPSGTGKDTHISPMMTLAGRINVATSSLGVTTLAYLIGTTITSGKGKAIPQTPALLMYDLLISNEVEHLFLVNPMSGKDNPLLPIRLSQDPVTGGNESAIKRSVAKNTMVGPFHGRSTIVFATVPKPAVMGKIGDGTLERFLILTDRVNTPEYTTGILDAAFGMYLGIPDYKIDEEKDKVMDEVGNMIMESYMNLVAYLEIQGGKKSRSFNEWTYLGHNVNQEAHTQLMLRMRKRFETISEMRMNKIGSLLRRAEKIIVKMATVISMINGWDEEYSSWEVGEKELRYAEYLYFENFVIMEEQLSLTGSFRKEDAGKYLMDINRTFGQGRGEKMKKGDVVSKMMAIWSISKEKTVERIDKLESYGIMKFESGKGRTLLLKKIDAEKIVEEYPLGKTDV